MKRATRRASANLSPDLASGAVDHFECRGPLGSKAAGVDHRYQAFREYRRGRDEIAVGACCKSAAARSNRSKMVQNLRRDCKR
jgi:hypothetical protein